MTDEELRAYSLGMSAAYSAVFAAFTKAFNDGQDIHWLRERISAQWNSERQTQIMTGFL